MDRKEMRRVIACLTCTAEQQGDTELARLLAQVHTALLTDQVGLLAACFGARRAMAPPHRGTREQHAYEPMVLLERVVG